jgi:hypothetical protein
MSWVDSRELIGGNTEEDVLKRGFQFPTQRGMTFTIGQFSGQGSYKAADKRRVCSS